MDPIDYLHSQAPDPDDVDRATLDELDARVAERTGLALRRRRRPVVAWTAAVVGAAAAVALAVFAGVALWPDDPDPVVEFGSGDGLVETLAATAAAQESQNGIGFLRSEVLSGPFSPAEQPVSRQLEDAWVDERGDRLVRVRPVGTGPGEAGEREGFAESGIFGGRPSVSEMQTWPHEPEALLRKLEGLPEERARDAREAASNNAFLLLAEPTTPPDLRAALIELLAEQPGAIVRPSAEDAVQISVTGPERTATGNFELATSRLTSFEEIAEEPEPLVGADTGDILVRYEYRDAAIVDEMGELP